MGWDYQRSVVSNVAVLGGLKEGRWAYIVDASNLAHDTINNFPMPSVSRALNYGKSSGNATSRMCLNTGGAYGLIGVGGFGLWYDIPRNRYVQRLSVLLDPDMR